MKKKYYKGLKLNEYEKEALGLKRCRKYNKLRKKLGRNEPIYWNYDNFFFINLYADLNAFIESSNHVDMTYHKFKDTNGIERTEIEMIEHIKSLIEELHETEFEFGKTAKIMNKEISKEQALSKDILMNLAIVMPTLWN